jgi:VCBS repeat protein
MGKRPFLVIALLAITGSLQRLPAAECPLNFSLPERFPDTCCNGLNGVADLDGDEFPDFLSGSIQDFYSLTILWSDSGNGFQAIHLPIGDRPLRPDAGDLDGDGVRDLAVLINTVPDKGRVTVLQNDGGMRFEAQAALNLDIVATIQLIADMDGDELLDLVEVGNQQAQLLKNQGGFKFSRSRPISLDQCLTDVIAVDVDQDGDLDLVSAHRECVKISLSLVKNRGDGTFDPPVELLAGTGARSLVAGDFDEDGLPDLVVADQGSEPIKSLRLFINRTDRPGSFLPDRILFQRPNGLGRVDAQDIDGDGHLDLVLLFGGRPRDWIFLNDPSAPGSFMAPEGLLARDQYSRLFLSDLNRDGRVDLAFGDDAGSLEAMWGRQTPVDCNSNGRSDNCDLLDGTSHDCNANDIPDECDIQTGLSADADGDGFPDECIQVFRRGDANDDGVVDIADRQFLVNWRFSGPEPDCWEAADLGADGLINPPSPEDDVYWKFLFTGGVSTLPPPGPITAGIDPAPTGIGCRAYTSIVPAPRIPDPDVIAGFSDAPLKITVVPEESEKFELALTLTVPDGAFPRGVEAWSMDVGVENLRVVDITTDKPDYRFYINTHLPMAELVGPPANRDGAVTAVSLYAGFPWEQKKYLRSGMTRVAWLTLEAKLAADGGAIQGRVFYVDGKQGSAQPVLNVVSIDGRAHRPTFESFTISIEPAPGGRQLPGDANQDGVLDLSDVVALLGHLYLGQMPQLPCEGGTAASPGPGELALLDWNADRAIDLSDAVSVLAWLFLPEGRPHPLGMMCTGIAGCRNDCPP